MDGVGVLHGRVSDVFTDIRPPPTNFSSKSNRVGLVYFNTGNGSIRFEYRIGGTKDALRDLVLVNKETSFVMAITTMFVVFVRFVIGV
jgi:hypothetical protein